MGIFSNKSKIEKRAEEIAKQRIMDMELEFDKSDKWAKALFSSLQQTVENDNLKDIVKIGYKSNPYVYAAINFIATKFSQIPRHLVKVQRNGKEVRIDSSDFVNYLKKPNQFQNFREFTRQWETIFCTTGNAMTYVPRLELGNNAGRLENGLKILPSHHIEIVKQNSGWQKPIDYYLLDIDQRDVRFDPNTVWHERWPTLDFEEGRQFMGMSPISVALKMVLANNSSQDLMNRLSENGYPPGILNKVADQYNEFNPKTDKSSFAKEWDRNHTGKNNHRPLYGAGGKISWQQIGISNLKDLQVQEFNLTVLRAVSSVLGLQSAPFNDPEASTYNNLKTEMKSAYENRIIPDDEQFLEGLSEYARAYGEGLRVRSDYSGIASLQEDKKSQAETLDLSWWIPIDRKQEAMGEDIDEQFKGKYAIPINKVITENPADLGLQQPDNSFTEEDEKFYKNMK